MRQCLTTGAGVAGLFLLLGIHFVIADCENGATMLQQQLEAAFEKVRALASERNSKALGQIAQQLEESWNTADAPLRAELLLEIVESLDTIADGETPSRARQHAVAILQHVDEFPVDIEIKLLRHVRPAVPNADEQSCADWPTERKRTASLWLHAARRLRRELDETFDPADMPIRNVSPPEGATGVRPGASPQHVKDPALRSEYEESIKSNKKKAERYNRQDSLHKLRRKFSRDIERFIVASYSAPPDARKELLDLMLDDVASDLERLKVMKAIDASWDRR